MPIPIIIFQHGLFQIEGRILPSAIDICDEQMTELKKSGLLDAATEFIYGVNGGAMENSVFVHRFIPKKARVVYHEKCRSECRTIVLIEEWVKQNQGEAYIYYQHQKGSSHAPGSDYGEKVSKPWRRGMQHDLVTNWRTCVADLEAGHDIACSHWMWNLADGSQHIPAGGFLWIRASFARTLPSIFLRERIKTSGIDSLESRYESEVFWGNGPKPNVKSYRPNGGNGVP